MTHLTKIELDETIPENWELRPLGKGQYEFVEPVWSHEIEDLLDEGFEASEEFEYDVAEEIILEVIKRAPNLLEAHLMLADLYFDMDKTDKRLEATQQAYNLLLTLLPKDFSPSTHKLSWDLEGNAILLRVLYSHACALADEGDSKTARDILEDLLKLDVEDNQDSRYLLPQIYLELGEPAQILKLVEQFPEDQGADMLWNRVLALLALKQPDQARLAIQEAWAKSPKVAQELLRSKHDAPTDLPPNGIEIGSEHEAFAYFLDMGDAWADQPGALQMLREVVQP
jgi:tetratricopeptide (TPR) repeat protein